MDNQNNDNNRFLSTGVKGLDTILGGGLTSDRLFLIEGPPGTGKSSLCAQYVYAATRRGEKAAMFLFEEATNNLMLRSTGLGIDLQGAVDDNLLSIQQIDPAEMAPGEFMQSVVDAEAKGAGVIGGSQAISVFKRRAGMHERTIRLFSMSNKGITVGDVLTNFHGILTGVPTFDEEDCHALLDDDNG